MPALLSKLIFNKYVLVIALLAVIFFMGKSLVETKAEKERIETNFNIERDNFKADLLVTERELKSIVKKDQKLIDILKDSMDIKSKQIENLIIANSKVIVKFKTVLKDSLIIKRDSFYIAKSFTYQDTWNRVTGLIEEDTVSVNVQSSDSLYIVHHTFKKGNWFLPRWFSKTYFDTKITNVNKNNTYFIEEKIKVLKDR